MAELLSIQVPRPQTHYAKDDPNAPFMMAHSPGHFNNAALSNARISNDLRKKVMNNSSCGLIMSHLPKRPAVDIQFNDICYSVDEGRARGYKTILCNVSGQFRSGRLTAIMGPSGAGKSTLMNITAGYRYSNVVGEILVNGRERNLRRFRKISCYIMQDDFLHPHLSVDESMAVSANLKIGSKMKWPQKQTVITEILETLSLVECRQTRACNLSGGQRKRLSIALELVNNPPVMFFDEPTSGLDSSSTTQCINLLKTLAQGGRTIICTIHQPSAKIFEKFDFLYALAEGQCIYRGAIRGLVPFLSGMALQCPAYHNPADFLLEVASGDYGEFTHKLTTAVRNGKCDNLCPDDPLRQQEGGKLGVNGGAGYHWSGETRVPTPTAAHSLLTPDDESIDDIPNSFPTSGWTQFVILYKRTFISSIRDGILTKMRISSYLSIGLLISLLYKNIGNDASKVFNNSGSLFFCMLFLMFTAMMPTILTFPLEMNVFIREHLNYWYSLKSYYLAITFADLPFQLVYPLLYVVLVYFMTDQPYEADRFFMFTAMCLMTSLVAQSLGLAIGAGMNIQAAVFLGPISSIPVLLFSGFFVSFSTIPAYLRWITYLSYVRYGFEGALLAIYGFDREKLECKQAYCHYKSPKKFLQELDMQDGSFWLDFMALVIFFVVIRICGYFVLKWKLKAER